MTHFLTSISAKINEALEKITQNLAIFLKYSGSLSLLAEVSYEEKMRRNILAIRQRLMTLDQYAEQTANKNLALELSELRHDILNHVNIIQGYSEMVQEAITDTLANEADLALEQILLQAKNLIRLVTALRSADN